MFKASTRYTRLDLNNEDFSSGGSFELGQSSLDSKENNVSCLAAQEAAQWPANKKSSLMRQKFLLYLAFSISLVLNLGLISEIIHLRRGPRQKSSVLPESDFAGLKYDQLIPWTHYTPYATTNLVAATELWDAIDFDSGFIALPYEYAAEKKLPKAQPFPWDGSKGIYLVNAYHSLHCLKSIHQYIRESDLNTTRSFPLEHITHCLDSLRQEALCTADDTPRWTDSRPGHALESGVGQYRQCRDFAKLEAWVKEYHSCYKRIDERHQCMNQLERYKFCPKGSPYEAMMREYFKVVMGRVLPDVIEEEGKPGMCESAKFVLGDGAPSDE